MIAQGTWAHGQMLILHERLAADDKIVQAETDMLRATQSARRARILAEWTEETGRAGFGYAASIVLLPSSQPTPPPPKEKEEEEEQEPEFSCSSSVGLVYECEQNDAPKKRSYEDVFGEDDEEPVYYGSEGDDDDFINDVPEEISSFSDDEREYIDLSASPAKTVLSRVQPTRMAKTNRPPPLLAKVKPRLDTFIATMGRAAGNVEVRGRIADIEAVIRNGTGTVGKWKTVSWIDDERTCDFCATESRSCGHSITVGGLQYFCGNNCYWSVKPLIELYQHVYTRARPSETKVENLMDEILTGSSDKRRRYANDEDDEKNDANEIDLTKSKKPRRKRRSKRF
jgi:hypothetical protein